MKKQKKILIVFPDRHLAYSQTTLNLKSFLSLHHDVKIAAFKSDSFASLNDKNVIYLKGKPVFFRVFNFISNYILLMKSFAKRLILWQKLCVMYHVLTHNYDEFIAVDLRGYWFLKFIRSKKIHLLSLELTSSEDDFIKKINFHRISSIIIQNKERLDYLTAGKFRGKTFFIQNAPSAIKDFHKTEASKNKLIYVGTARLQFGVNYCLEFINKYPEYELHIQGHIEANVNELIKNRYSNLVAEKRLIINNKYLSEDELIHKVSECRIGFCFYDLNFPELNNFNYWTAPSGKMFTCFAAGVPIIGSNIEGLKPIEIFESGMLLEKYDPDHIKKAIDSIELNYSNFSLNCLKAAKHYDFKENAKLFREYLDN